MAGQVKRLIEELVEIRAQRDAGISHFLRALLLLKGIDADKYDEHSRDDPQAIAALREMIANFKAQR